MTASTRAPRRRTRRALALAATALAMLASGCPGVRHPPERPTVSVRGVDIATATSPGLEAVLAVDVANPNSVDAVLRAVDWELEIDGAGAVRGRSLLTADVPARAATAVVVPMQVAEPLATAIHARLAAGARDYRVAATLHFETTRGDLAVWLDHAGALRE